MGFSFLPREDQYFSLFAQMAEKIQEASRALLEMLEGPSGEYESASKRIKSVEHECDELTHTITTRLNKSFITPFDREDIYTLSVALDDVCDYIDAAARAAVIYNVREVNEYIVDLARIITKQSDEIHSAVVLLKGGKGMPRHLLEIQRLENDADEVYFKSIGELFKNSGDPLTIIKLKELYEILENATDRCESVANIIESIVLKHN
ncbi:MAG: DUF47 domain-containing protein [Pyrinomonadaceae bacterium]|nr:DUF47 domain-containing protein [Pyrinomonadaceae bacterium]